MELNMYIFLTMTVCCGLIFSPAQHEETDPGMFNTGCICTAVPRDSLSLRESIGCIYFSTAKKIAVEKQLQGTANLFTE